MNSIIGALVGDAAGAVLEGYHNITEEMVDHALTMPGGGKLQVGPGQITDDGELTLSLWRAIQNNPPSLGLPIPNIIKSYQDWYNSFPFDIGRTCSLAFEISDEDIEEYKKQVFQFNKGSQANGSLMRATAIASWVAPYLEIGPEKAAEFAMEDAQLSHPNIICQETNAIYVYTIVNLIRGISPKDALQYTSEFVEMNDFSPIVKQWFFKESLEIKDINVTIQIGHVRWGFVLAFYFLRNPTISYEDAIRITLLKGGDTDTNACIIGGLVGTYQSIPSFMKDPVFIFDCTKQKMLRPREYSVRNMIQLS